MMIFYFAVFKKEFGIWFIFVMGIWNDALNGNPLGVTALCYILLVKFFILLNVKMMIRDSFKQILQQFIIFCFCFLLMKWIMLSVFAGVFLNFTNAIVQFVISSTTYVLMHKFFDYLSAKLLPKN